MGILKMIFEAVMFVTFLFVMYAWIIILAA